MKVIGKIDHETYLVQVSHSEIEKVTDKYYGGIAKKFEVGDRIDIAAGYDFRSDIRNACDSMLKAMHGFEKSREALTKFAIMVTELKDEEA